MTKPKSAPCSQSEFSSILSYDPENGKFFWVKKRGRFLAGTEAGHRGKNGYVSICVNGKLYLRGRLAWFYMTGEWPNEIDHINRIRGDGRFINLRKAETWQNQGNRKHQSNSKTGLKGVSINECFGGKYCYYRATIEVKGKRINLGNFPTPEKAHEAYAEKARELFGEFACTI